MNNSAAFDAIGLGILWHRLISIADEGVSTLVRTAFSTAVREGYYSGHAARRRWSAAGPKYAEHSFLHRLGPSYSPTHVASRPPATLRPGDVVITNDPWMGTGHLYDINVMRPIFRAGQIAAYGLSITHLPDIGGSGFGGDAGEIHQEGLRLPACKWLRRLARRAPA